MIWIGRVDGKAGLSSALIVWFGIEWFAVIVEPITSATYHLTPNKHVTSRNNKIIMIWIGIMATTTIANDCL
jgi:hypothetical protein